MSRIASLCLVAVVAFVSVAGMRLATPVAVLAASGTLRMETPLHESPDHASPLIALLAEGSVVSIDGPPVDGFYPVTTGNLTGWMRGETLELTKDIDAEAAEALAASEPVNDSALLAQETTAEPPAAAPETLAMDDAAAAPVQTGESTGDLPPPEPATEPAPDAGGDLAPISEPLPVDASDGEAVPAAPLATEPTPDPNVTPLPVVEAAPVGPAGAIRETAVRVGPGESYGLITTVPPGSVVEQTGHLIDGYVSVQYGDVTGWAAIDHLGDPNAAVAEPSSEATVSPEPAAAPEAEGPADAREGDAAGNRDDATGLSAAPSPTPEPAPAPLGPASVIVDMPIRTGPRPDTGLIFTVPQGSTVERTGQLVDGFVSVQYKEVIGWAAAEHMAEPIAMVDEALPEESAKPVDTKEPKPGSGVAFATVDLSLRAGPSANEEPIVVVPAGSRLVLTGVMEGDFQRVTYGDDIGWIANEYLATPESPAPNGEHTGKKQNYSEREIIKIIYQAADRYDQPRNDMLRVARCESNLDPYAVNPSGSYGLFQFIRSTWKSTPFGGEDIFDPAANANAAAWMWSEGRKSEWVCQ